MSKLAFPLHILKNDHGRRESDLVRLPERCAENAVRHVRAAAEVTAMRDTEENLEAEIAALKVDAEQVIVEGTPKIELAQRPARRSQASARKLRTSTKQQKERQP